MEVIAVKAVCEHCGKAFLYEKHKPGRQRRFCSDKCRHRLFVGVQNCAFCNAEITGNKRKYCDEYCRRQATLAVKSKCDKLCRVWMHNCQECGKVFAAKAYNTHHCSNTCHRDAKARHAREMRAQGKYSGPTKKCAHCSRVFVAKHSKGQVYCSRTCRFAEHAVKTIASVVMTHCNWCGSNVRRIPTHTTFRKYGGDRVAMCLACERQLASDGAGFAGATAIASNPVACCINCNRLFIREGSSTKTCSEACQSQVLTDARWRAKKRRAARQVRKNDGTVRRRMVFERDNWTCMICHGKVRPRRLAANQPDEATVDHIVPLARGGAHSMDNVQTACRLCNSLKSDHSQPPQRGRYTPGTPPTGT